MKANLKVLGHLAYCMIFKFKRIELKFEGYPENLFIVQGYQVTVFLNIFLNIY